MENQKGFTLIELLIVIVIISILAAIIFVAVDPARRFGDARDARRRAEAVSILNAVLKYQVDNNGSYPGGIDSTTASYQVLGTDATGCSTTCTATTTEDACLDLSGDLVDTYLFQMPTDPGSGTSSNTDYAINKTNGGRISVVACDPDNASTISVQR